MATNWNVTAAAGKTGFDTTYAFASTLGQYATNRITAGMNTQAYRSQARLNLLASERRDSYINEGFAHDVWNATDRAIATRGARNAYYGASGLDISSGDIRAQRSIEDEANAYAAGRNRTAYLQSFENQMEARLEATRLEYAARAQDSIRKLNSGSRALTAGFFNALGAFAGNIGTLGAAGAFGKAGKATNIAPVQGA